jgi:hypothetical protein
MADETRCVQNIGGNLIPRYHLVCMGMHSRVGLSVQWIMTMYEKIGVHVHVLSVSTLFEGE